MVRLLSFAVSLTILCGSPNRCLAQTKVAPLYSLPVDGVWVEFDFQSKDRLNKENSGAMRISSTGRAQVGDVPHRWIEIKMAGGAIQTRYGKLLVAEGALRDGGALADGVAEAYHQ